jgi:hypothetical protein
LGTSMAGITPTDCPSWIWSWLAGPPLAYSRQRRRNLSERPRCRYAAEYPV